MIDSIIFDVDGTLWDSTPIVAESWNDVIKEQLGQEMHLTDDDLKKLFGRLLPDIAAVIFKNETKEEQLRLIDLCCEEEHRALLRSPAPIYPGLEDALKTLSQKYRLFIVSNCQAGYIEVFLQATGLSQYFEGHLCPGDTGNAKAANISEVVSTYKLQSAVYVGDTAGDYNAAREAGLPFIFASYGFGTVETPDAVITSLEELSEVVEAI